MHPQPSSTIIIIIIIILNHHHRHHHHRHHHKHYAIDGEYHHIRCKRFGNRGGGSASEICLARLFKILPGHLNQNTIAMHWIIGLSGRNNCSLCCGVKSFPICLYLLNFALFLCFIFSNKSTQFLAALAALYLPLVTYWRTDWVFSTTWPWPNDPDHPAYPDHPDFPTQSDHPDPDQKYCSKWCQGNFYIRFRIFSEKGASPQIYIFHIYTRLKLTQTQVYTRPIFTQTHVRTYISPGSHSFGIINNITFFLVNLNCINNQNGFEGYLVQFLQLNQDPGM